MIKDEKTALENFKEAVLLVQKFETAKRVFHKDFLPRVKIGLFTNEDLTKACIYMGKLYASSCIQAIKFDNEFTSEDEYQDFTEKYQKEVAEYAYQNHLEMTKDVFRNMFGEEAYEQVKDLTMDDILLLWSWVKGDAKFE